MQRKPEYSLGGFKSSTAIQNDVLGNMFSDVSQYTSEKASKEYVALVLKNELPIDVSDVSIWFTYPDNSVVKFEVAPVSYVTSMEAVMNVNSQPFNATFYEANGIDNLINIGDIAIGNSVGLWFRRSILKDVIELQKQHVYLITQHGQQLVTNEEIGVNIAWASYYGGSLGLNNL
jgi:hypothetical protein